MSIRAEILEMSAYRPPLEGRSREYLLCDFNERIDPIAAHIKNALVDFINADQIQLYPSYGGFAERLAEYAEVRPDELLVTNGSDQAIELIVRATCKRGGEAILPAPSFAYYRQVANVEALRVVQIRFNDDFSFPTERVLDALSDNTQIVFLPNPNNPTGTGIPRIDILNIARRAPRAAILVDECYFEYTGETVRDILSQYTNLFVTRTFSKTWGLAALRIGYILSARENIENLNKVRGPYDVNKLAVVGATAAIENRAYMEDYVREVLCESKPLMESWLASRNVRYVPSAANFVLTFPKHPDRVLDLLREDGILVRPQRGPMLEGALRMSFGRRPETERLIASLDRILTKER